MVKKQGGSIGAHDENQAVHIVHSLHHNTGPQPQTRRLVSSISSDSASRLSRLDYCVSQIAIDRPYV
jgi:hypothetical protein